MKEGSMAEKPLRRLTDIPFGNREPVIAGDSPFIEHWAAAHGYAYSSITSAETPAIADLFIVCTERDMYRRVNHWREVFAGSRVLWVPFAAFDGGDEAVSYGLAQLTHPDLSDVLLEQASLAGMLDEYRNLKVSHTSGNIAYIQIPESASIIRDAPQGELKLGDFISVISYFETGTEYGLESEPVNAAGSMAVQCLLYARAPSGRSTPAELAQAKTLAQVADATECHIDLDDGRITSFRIQDAEALTVLEALAGKRLGLKLTEFSVGLNDRLQNPRWELNSPVNEGAAGVHIGIGDGYSGLHFDFVCPGAVISSV
jgi:hypothetical protein